MLFLQPKADGGFISIILKIYESRSLPADDLVSCASSRVHPEKSLHSLHDVPGEQGLPDGLRAFFRLNAAMTPRTP